MIYSAHAVGEHRFGHGTRRTQAGRHSRLACEDMAKQHINNIIRPVRVYRLTMSRKKQIWTRVFSVDGKRRRRDHDFSVQSAAALGAVIK